MGEASQQIHRYVIFLHTKMFMYIYIHIHKYRRNFSKMSMSINFLITLFLQEEIDYF